MKIRVAEPKKRFVMSLLMLVGAIFASLALGVLMAYGICQGMFQIFLAHAHSTARRGQTSSVSVEI